MNAEIDIENSQTQKVISIKVPIIKFDSLSENIFDISSISDEERKLLIDAINPKLAHTDIEMFYVNTEPYIPNFGPDYSFRIDNNKLHSINERIKLIEKRKKMNYGGKYMSNKYIGEVRLDIENAKTQDVECITLPILEYSADDKFVFDITNLNKNELRMLEDAIDPSLTYTDIELFYVSMEDGMFNYGDDFEYVIESGKLKGKYIREEVEKKIKEDYNVKTT